MKKRIVLALFVLSVMMGLTSVSASVATVDMGTGTGGVATVSPLRFVIVEVFEPQVSIPESDGGDIVMTDPVVVDEGNTTNSEEYIPISIVVPDVNTGEGGEAIVTVGDEVLWTTFEFPTFEFPEAEVQPPEVLWTNFGYPDVEIRPPEIVPPEVGTCEYPGHPPCSPVEIQIPDAWIMPQWFQWEIPDAWIMPQWF